MPYSLVFKYSDGKVGEIKPLCADNPKSEFNFEDRRILQKADRWSKELTKAHDDLECSVKHYNIGL